MATILSSDTSTRQHNPSLLVQLLQEVPHRQQRNKLVEGVPVQDVPVARFPASTSKLAGRGSGVGGGLGLGISGGSWGGGSGAKLALRGGSRVIGIGGGPVMKGGGQGGAVDAPREREKERGRAALPPIFSTTIRSSKRANSAEKAAVQIPQPLHLPAIKRPTLSGELRRRVLLNASTSLLREQEKRQHQRVVQESRVMSPARAGSRSSLRNGNGNGRGRGKGRVSVLDIRVETGTGDVTRLAKGMCTTADESVVREKVRKILQEDGEEKKLNVGHQGEIQGEEPTYTTGTATRNLRRHFTHQKISHKKKALERAFGWHSQVLDVGQDINVQIGRFAARNQDETSPVPIGESVSGSEFVGAIKVAGSIGSKGSSGVNPQRVVGEWMDEEDDVDAVMVGGGAVRRGKRGQFQRKLF